MAYVLGTGITATIVVDSALPKEQKLETLYQLLFALAPHIDRNASTTHTRYYRLVSRLMDEAVIRRLVGYEKGRSVYQAISKGIRLEWSILGAEGNVRIWCGQ